MIKRFKIGDKIKIEIEILEKENLINYETMQNEQGKVLHIRGEIIGYCIGQCQKEIYEALEYEDIYPPEKKKAISSLFSIWKKYHANDLIPGCKEQEDFIEKNNLNTSEYDEVCHILKQNNLYIVNGYKYGSKWLYKPIPLSDLLRFNMDIETLTK